MGDQGYCTSGMQISLTLIQQTEYLEFHPNVSGFILSAIVRMRGLIAKSFELVVLLTSARQLEAAVPCS